MKISLNRSASRGAQVLAVALAIALCAGIALSELAAAQVAETVPYSAIYSQDNPIPEIAKNVRPAVVQVISILENWTVQDGVSSMEQGYGSGVYIDKRGYIVTNNHVIEDADHVEIETLDGRRIQCEIVGRDSGTDIAVIKAMEKLDANPVPMGDSDALAIGELAIAIGNPGDSVGVLFGTVTAGIISALDRSDVNANNFTRKVNVIQTDAAINTGNSGGALLNAKGELIGIPTLKIMSDLSTVYEGLGFAVPINTAKPVIEQLIANGKVTRPRIGVQVATFEGPNEPLKNYPPAGVQVMVVEPGGPADKAGLMLYDIITKIEGIRVKASAELIDVIDQHGAGDVVKIEVYRCYNPVDGTLLRNPEMLELQMTLALLD